MRKQDFYGLPRSIQDRFIESSQAIAAPAPLAVFPVGEKASFVWGGAAVLCGIGWAAFTSHGMGDLYSPFALTSWTHKAIHAAFAGTFAGCVLRAYALSWAERRLPYGSGNYLFPSGVIAARGARLTEYDAKDVQAVSADVKVIKVAL